MTVWTTAATLSQIGAFNSDGPAGIAGQTDPRHPTGPDRKVIPEMTPTEIEPFAPEMLTRDKWIGLIYLSPEGARTLIGMNTRNRKIKAGRISQYADAIIDGRWQVTPDAIAVESGALVNGQHRCRAIIEADRTVPVALMVNAGTAFDVVDNGASRTASDVLFLAGLSDNPGALARATKLYLSECGVGSNTLADNRYIERWVIDHAELDTWVTWAEDRRASTRTEAASILAVPAAVLGFAVEGVVDNTEQVLSLPHLVNVRGPRAIKAEDRVPTLDMTRAYLQRLLTRTGVEDGSVEQTIVNDLDRWINRSATDRRVAKPQAPETLRLITWGLDQLVRGTAGRQVHKDALAGPWLWAKPLGQQALFSG